MTLPVPHVGATETSPFDLTDFHKQLRNEVADLASSFSREYWRERDRLAEYPWDFLKAFARGGWLGMSIPREYGGSGLGILEAAIMLHAICESGAGTTGASPVHFFIFPLAPVIKYGSEDMKREFLPRAAQGELMVAFGVTEPNAGSDTSRISTTARKTAGGWIIDGQKTWTTNAQNAERILLIARTSPREASRPFHGLTLFFAPLDRRACIVRPIEKLGRSAVDSNDVFINGLSVSDRDVVGDVDRGFYHLVDALNPERIVIAMEAAGIGRAALRMASEYAKSRVVFDRAIGQNQAIAHPLARCWAELSAAELLALKAASMFDRNIPCGVEASAAKLLAADAGFAACDVALQVFGGYGYSKEYDIERLWREVRLYRLAPLSQELTLNHLAKHALGLSVL